MRTNRIVALLMAVLMIAGCLAACGGGDTETTNSATSDGTTTAVDTSTPKYEPWSAEDIADMGEQIKKEANGQKITLKVWQPEAAVETFKAQAAKFVDTFKDYATIEINVVAQGEGDAAANVIADPKAAADVFGFASDQINQLADAGALAPVTYSVEVPYMNTENTVAAATVGGKLLAYPETGDNSYFLAYDKRLVTAEQAASLETLLEVSEAAGKKFILNAGDGYFACMFLFTGGLETNGFEADGITQKFNDYDIDKVSASVQAFAELFKSYPKTYESADPSRVADGFKNGTTAAGVVGSWNVANVKAALGENAGFATLPTIKVDGTDTKIKSMFGYKFVGVNSQTQFMATSQALAYFLTNEECQLERVTALEWGPSNKNVIASDTVKNSESMSQILAQAEFSVAQTAIAKTFWDPCKALGTYIIEPKNDFSDAAIKAQVEECIKNIKDE